ncbi:MAG: hypothetical protein U5R49_21915 [Deltaproteobacteria bacterium]|nr:hypothetical protein [Deltaproteobacteria bacterium]
MRNFIAENDVHPHLAARLRERGITLDEFNMTLANGWQAQDAKEGTSGKVYVFEYNRRWLGKVFAEKEVSIYYKILDGRLVPLTAKARYGSSFQRKGEKP